MRGYQPLMRDALHRFAESETSKTRSKRGFTFLD